MTYSATVIADSISPMGSRIITLSLHYPRFILAEFNTHRMISRNSASFRAIPTTRLIYMLTEDPVEPVEWGKNCAGMQAPETLSKEVAHEAKKIWDDARDTAALNAARLKEQGVHKQLANRLLEPFVHTDTVATATKGEWRRMLALRLHPDAQPEIQQLAYAIDEAINFSTPKLVGHGEWHTPFLPSSIYSLSDQLICSAARCARVSYSKHDGTGASLESDQKLAERLKEGGHWSPFEHQATPDLGATQGNLEGWKQLRHILQDKLPL